MPGRYGPSRQPVHSDRPGAGQPVRLPLDSRRCWYRYHALFADLLRHRLHQALPPAERLELVRHACAWYEQEGLIAEAVAQAFGALDYPLVTQLLERHVLAIFFRSETLLVHHWLQSLPEEILLQSPLLSAVYANTCGHAGMFHPESLEKAEHWLKTAEKAFSVPTQDRENDALTRSLIGLSRAYLALWCNDPPQVTIDLARRALATLPPEGIVPPDSDFQRLRSGLTNNLGLSYMVLGDAETALQVFIEAQRIGETCGDLLNWFSSVAFQCQLLSIYGRLPEALVSLCRKVLITSPSSAVGLEGSVPYVALIYLAMGKILLEWNELEEAEAAFKKSLKLSRLMVATNRQVESMIALACLHMARRNIPEAFNWLDQVKLISTGENHIVSAWQARLYLADSRAPRCSARGNSLGSRAYSSANRFHLVFAGNADHGEGHDRTAPTGSSAQRRGMPDMQSLQDFLSAQVHHAQASHHIGVLAELYLLRDF